VTRVEIYAKILTVKILCKKFKKPNRNYGIISFFFFLNKTVTASYSTAGNMLSTHFEMYVLLSCSLRIVHQSNSMIVTWSICDGTFEHNYFHIILRYIIWNHIIHDEYMKRATIVCRLSSSPISTDRGEHKYCYECDAFGRRKINLGDGVRKNGVWACYRKNVRKSYLFFS